MFSILVANGGPKIPKGPLYWQGRRSYGPTRFGYACHTVLLMCTRDPDFGAQLDEEESWSGMIAIMRHPFKQQKRSSKASDLGAHGRSVVAGLVSAYRLSFRNGRPPIDLASQWVMKRELR